MFEWDSMEQINISDRKKQEEIQIESKNNEEIERLKIKLMDFFDLSTSMEALNAMPQNEEIIGSAINYLEKIAADEQEKLAEDFFNKTIGKNVENRTRANMVSELFRGTPFAEKFRELTNESV